MPQPEEEHEVHTGSKRSGTEAAAAAAVEEDALQQQVGPAHMPCAASARAFDGGNSKQTSSLV